MQPKRRRSRRARLASYTAAEAVTVIDKETGAVLREEPAYGRREYRQLVSGPAAAR